MLSAVRRQTLSSAARLARAVARPTPDAASFSALAVASLQHNNAALPTQRLGWAAEGLHSSAVRCAAGSDPQATKDVKGAGATSVPAEFDDALKAELEHATGLERMELEAAVQGASLFDEAWVNAPFGTEENPVKVPSMFAERIIGVTDPDDDSHVIWGVLREGERLVLCGQHFELERVTGEAAHHH
mmetsp:Transcript_11233/g.41126  ORF Transcript_11233/g.41126 Transcript_11233/m.41126 type:complete len:187 (+) Transcript_11233:181-741(+)